jgi:polyisoprenyl-phosphate glycosyltransferase
MVNRKFIIITPIYEDAKVAEKLFSEVGKEYGENAYIVAVDDGSLDSVIKIEAITRSNLQGVILRLNRNVGHQKAIAIGLNYAAIHLNDSRNVVIMDSDGEDIPSSISFLLEKLDNENTDIVVAKRNSRVETIKFRLFYFLYKGVFLLLSGKVINFGNFMALKPLAVNRLITMQELWIHVAGCVILSKLRISHCKIDRGPRYSGRSKMNFVSLVLHGFKSLMIFSEDVLVRVGIACILIALVSIAGGMAAILLKTFGFATPGWFSVVFGILTLVFLQTGMLTLMSLMLTGVMKGGAATTVDYRKYVKEVLSAEK